MAELLSVEAAVQRKLPDSAGSGHYDAKVLEVACPACGQPIVCVYADLGHTDYYDNYDHICLNPDCDYRKNEERFSCNVGGRQELIDDTCAICGRQVSLTF